jgi:DNA-binding winged helix-turn-helix (wHTH) protein
VLPAVGHDQHQPLRIIIEPHEILTRMQAEGAGWAKLAMQISGALAGRSVFAFGPFLLLPSQRLLLDGDKSVPIGSRAFDILTILVEHAGEVVEKDELIAKVWPTVFVEPSNLKTQVSALRRALRDDHSASRYIVTVPGRGYSFVAPICFGKSCAD